MAATATEDTTMIVVRFSIADITAMEDVIATVMVASVLGDVTSEATNSGRAMLGTVDFKIGPFRVRSNLGQQSFQSNFSKKRHT